MRIEYRNNKGPDKKIFLILIAVIVGLLALNNKMTQQKLASWSDGAKQKVARLFRNEANAQNADGNEEADSEPDRIASGPKAFDAATAGQKFQYEYSLKSMTKLVKKVSANPGNLRGLITDLKMSKQEPTLTKDSNPHTGDLLIVRTQSPLPGTRYFQTQLLGSNTEGYSVQHLSFEFAPGEKSLTMARQAVEAEFPNLGQPEVSRANFISWHLNEDYTLWIKVLDKEDIEFHPVNAYSSEDIGTIKVALEHEIH